MSDPGLIEIISALMTMLIDQMWTMVAGLFDASRNIGAFGAGMAVLGMCLTAFGVAKMMQARLVHKLDDDPESDVSMLVQEARFSLPGLVLFVLALPFLILNWLISTMSNAVGSLFSSDDEEEEEKKEEKKEEEPPVPLVVASIGPSFMWAGLIVAAIFVLSLLIEPLLRHQFDLSEGYPAWQYLILGGRAEMEWYVPLGRFPYLGALASLFVWGTLWWWAGRVVRIVLGSDLGSNLADRVQNTGVLTSWRTWFGARFLSNTDETYRRWAMWLPIIAVPFLFWAWSTFAAEPYRIGGSLFAVSLLLWLSWVLHLTLSGEFRLVEEEPEEEPEPEPEEAAGWPEVLADLEGRFQVREPSIEAPPRLVEPPQPAARAPKSGLLSPLLDEVLPEGEKPRHMQQAVLETLSHQAYVHVDPPQKVGDLALGRTSSAGMDDESGLRHRNQVVLAPDASGKTTLAMLAACNHALVHTRATLIVTRDEDAAERFAELLRSTLEPSTLRWTVRVRKAGSTLVNDLSQGIIPDVIVTSLHALVGSILDKPRTYAPFLKNLGLIVVDDVQSFCGPVEIHMQLAFRRLTLRVRQLLDIRQLGEESAPVTLVLGVDSMHDTPAWAKTLCGIDAVTRTFGYAHKNNRSDAVPGVGSVIGPGLPKLADLEPGRYHLHYQLSDFETGADQPVSVGDIIASCERLEIPWHYRTCGDMRRDSGWQGLRLEQEPQHDADSPTDACVVFLEGSVSEVRREISHLAHAGLRFGSIASGEDSDAEPVPIAFVSVTDPDERAALSDMRPNSSLAEIAHSLPRPVVRAPFGRAVEAHLSADLVDTWMEVADILDVFGNTTVDTLARLADNGLLVHQSHTDLDTDQSGYEEQVHVRVPSRAVAPDEDALAEDDTQMLLAPKVAQVELPPGPSVAIRDRTNLTIIERTDRESARHLYYPGRIFENARGRYVVVEQGAGSEPGGPVSEADIFVEPFLNDEISSPRRRTTLTTGATPSLASEPIFIGDFPLAVFLGPVECTTTHFATFRLDPNSFTVRQRILLSSPGLGSPGTDNRDHLNTVALGIIANPDLEVVQEPDCPRLKLQDARLIAASMRAMLPSLYRGASSDIQVALNIAADNPGPNYMLGPQDGFFLYDPHLGGNGAAQAIHRDGVELLLRLSRVYLLRLASVDRLLTRYDFWAGQAELVGRAPDADANKPDAQKTGALEWLDSRLRPEDGEGDEEIEL